MRVECRCLSGFSSSLIVGPGLEPARVPGGGVNCNDMQGQTSHTHRSAASSGHYYCRNILHPCGSMTGYFEELNIGPAWTDIPVMKHQKFESLQRCLMELDFLFASIYF